MLKAHKEPNTYLRIELLDGGLGLFGLVGIAAAGTGVTLLLTDDGGLYLSPMPNGVLVGGRFQ